MSDMFSARCTVSIVLLVFGEVLSAPVPDLDGSASVNQAVGIFQAGAELKNNLLSPPDLAREDAKLESEGLSSRVLTIYDDKQRQTADFFNPKPIIDTISEADKYGNNGDQFYAVGRAIVNGYESFANLMNKLLNKPSELAKNFSRGITKQLDMIGGKLIGLA